MKQIYAAVAAASLMVSAAASAQTPQPKPIKISAKSAFKHRHSKIELPPVLLGLARTNLLETEADQLDVVTEYSTPDRSEVYTVYIYRQVAGALPVWFDRARWMIEHRDIYGKPTARAAEPAFVPPGQVNASGLAATYDLTGKSHRSTGIAMVPAGEWLVKLRVSSSSLNAAELEGRLKAALAAMNWPSRMPAAPAASLVQPCSSGLKIAGNANPAPKDDNAGAAMLLDALLGSALVKQAASKNAPSAPPARWCRDSTELPAAGVYRANESEDSYLIAIADAGRAIEVGQSAGQQMLAQTGTAAPGKETWSIKLLLLPRTLNSAAFDRLPPPRQAWEVVQEGRFASATSTWGDGKKNISINTDALR